MNIIKHSALAIAIASTLPMALADNSLTYNYEILDSQVNIDFPFPPLDLNKISGGSVVYEESLPDGKINLKQFKLEFENAPSLRVSQLKHDTTGRYQCPNGGSDIFVGSVKHQWLFREVDVVLCPSSMGPTPVTDFSFEISAKTFEQYDSSNMGILGLPLVSGDLFAENVTPNPVTDILTTQYEGKRLRLKLLKRPADTFDPATGTGGGFGVLVKANWLGHGEKTLVVENLPISSPFITTIAVNLINNGDFEELSIKYTDESGTEMEYREDLRYLLEKAYGPF